MGGCHICCKIAALPRKILATVAQIGDVNISCGIKYASYIAIYTVCTKYIIGRGGFKLYLFIN
jgi:hypothetical protein